MVRAVAWASKATVPSGMGGPPEDWKRGRIPQVEAWGLRGTQTLTLAHSCGTAR